MTTWHDAKCEWFTSEATTCRTCGALPSIGAPHCHCGSRAFVLCDGCRKGMRLAHTGIAQPQGVNRPCQCDLCTDEVAA